MVQSFFFPKTYDNAENIEQQIGAPRKNELTVKFNDETIWVYPFIRTPRVCINIRNIIIYIWKFFFIIFIIYSFFLDYGRNKNEKRKI